MNVKSSAKVKVGVLTDTTTSATGPESYMFETVTPNGSGNTVKWQNGTTGLGQVLNFDGLNLGADKAIGEGTATVIDDGTVTTAGTATEKVVLNKIDTGKSIIKAASTGKISNNKEPYDPNKVLVADANKDYLDATIGVQPAQNDLEGTYVKVVVKTTGTRLTLGMNAAVHIVIQIGEKQVDIEPFGTSNKNSTVLSTVSTGFADGGGYLEYSSADKSLTSTFYFWVAKGSSTSKLSADTISQFRIMAYIAGADTDCNSNFTDSGCTMDISFDGTLDVGYLEKGKENTKLDGSTTIKMYDVAAA